MTWVRHHPKAYCPATGGFGGRSPVYKNQCYPDKPRCANIRICMRYIVHRKKYTYTSIMYLYIYIFIYLYLYLHIRYICFSFLFILSRIAVEYRSPQICTWQVLTSWLMSLGIVYTKLCESQTWTEAFVTHTPRYVYFGCSNG